MMFNPERRMISGMRQAETELALAAKRATRANALTPAASASVMPEIEGGAADDR